MQNFLINRYAGLHCNDVEVKIKNLTITNSNGLTSTCCQFIAESLYKSTIDNSYTTTWEKMVEKYGATQ